MCPIGKRVFLAAWSKCSLLLLKIHPRSYKCSLHSGDNREQKIIIEPPCVSFLICSNGSYSHLFWTAFEEKEKEQIHLEVLM